MIGIIVATVIALILGLILVVLDNLFKDKSSKKKDYLKYLPGYNCGACGFGSCAGMAKAMDDNVENYKKCKPLRGETLKKMEEYIEK